MAIVNLYVIAVWRGSIAREQKPIANALGALNQLTELLRDPPLFPMVAALYLGYWNLKA